MQLSRAGLTLVELLVVLALLAVLASIAVTSYERYRYQALVAQAQSDIRVLDNVIAQFVADTMRFPDSLADLPMPAKFDPWKHPYQYLKLSPPDKNLIGQARKDKNLVPINSDYDLYSMGKDGKSVSPLTAAASRDDIVRASNGRFVGLASDY